MKLSFHGAAQTVTGSKHLLSLDNGFTVLLDCGLFQGMGARTGPLNRSFGFDAASVDAVLLSHAHIDHSGLLPKLVAEGFAGKIYCTPATRDLTEILLFDSAEIQSRENDDAAETFTLADVKQAICQIEAVTYDSWFALSPEVDVLYTQTGHLIGSAAINLQISEAGKTTTLHFSADVGRARHPLLRPAAGFPQAEYIILESTYGDKHHELQTRNLDVLLDWITKTCLKKGGKLIIPAFSVGRTQELLYLLNQLELEKRLPPLKYFVDSPLSQRATAVVKSHLSEFNDQIQQILKIDDDPFHFEGLKYVETSEDSARLVAFDEPCVVLSASGTADAGRVRHHIKAVAGDKKNTILFSGYCGPESLGGKLLAGAKVIEVFGESQEVFAEVAQLKGLSAHGDADDLCQFLACQNPGLVRTVFLVHGEQRAQEALAHKLSARGFHPVTIPALHETVALNVSRQKVPAG